MVSAFATSYFPTVGYLRAICTSENTWMDIGERYIKQTERNRANILTANGAQNLSIPVIRPNGNKSLTKEIQISFVEAWQRDHVRALEAAYSSSPYFEHYSEEVFNLINSKINSLHEFNDSILKKIQQWLDLPIQLKISDNYIENQSIDFRDFKFKHDVKSYIQVDFGQNEFVANLSVLDALFCLGPMARKLILN